MNAPSEIRWLGEQALGALQASFSQRLSAWAQAWGLAPVEALDVQVWTAQESGTASHTPDWQALLGQALFGAGWRASRLAPEVLKDCCAQLQQLLLQRDEPALPPRAGHLGVWLSLSLCGQACRLPVPMSALHEAGLLSRRAELAALPRWSAERVMADLPLQLQAQFKPLSIDVVELLKLAEGDVLVLPQRLDEPLQLSLADSTLQLRAHLGREGSQRALQCLAG